MCKSRGSFTSTKEADKWEEQFYTCFDEEVQIEYGVDASGGALDERGQLCKDVGQREAARKLDVPRETLRKVLTHGCKLVRRATRERIARNGSA